MSLLRDCQLQVVKPNPRQYVAHVSQMPGLEVWFQRASDVVRKVALGDVDLGIVGTDMVEELACGHPDVVVVHEALGFGKCRLALGVPCGSRWAEVDSIDDLRAAGWTAERPLRVVSGYAALARRFFEERGFEHVRLLSGDGALEAAPAMGTADIILDLVSSGVTLRENNLREIRGGTVLRSQGVLVANRRSLLERRGLLPIVRELLERLDAHLTAEGFYNVVANMRGASPEAVAAALLGAGESLRGLQGPTVSPVYTKDSGSDPAYYAAQVCVPRSTLYETIKAIRGAGGSGVLVLPVTYIFNEETERWQKLIQTLGVSEDDVDRMESEVNEERAGRRATGETSSEDDDANQRANAGAQGTTGEGTGGATAGNAAAAQP